jgi:hypothetical protein
MAVHLVRGRKHLGARHSTYGLTKVKLLVQWIGKGILEVSVTKSLMRGASRRQAVCWLTQTWELKDEKASVDYEPACLKSARLSQISHFSEDGM